MDALKGKMRSLIVDLRDAIHHGSMKYLRQKATSADLVET